MDMLHCMNCGASHGRDPRPSCRFCGAAHGVRFRNVPPRRLFPLRPRGTLFGHSQGFVQALEEPRHELQGCHIHSAFDHLQVAPFVPGGQSQHGFQIRQPNKEQDVFECYDMIKKQTIRVCRHKNLSHVGGSFNNGIILCEELTTNRKLIQKVFLERDLPHVYKREVWALQALKKCPFIINMISNKNSGNYMPPQAWILFEYCDLGTLAALIERYKTRGKQFPESFVLQVFWSLVEALSFMQNGEIEVGRVDRTHEWILHGDMHPGNIFLRTSSRRTGELDVILADFGSSQHFRSWNDEPLAGRDVAQHPHYRVPDRTWNRRSDLYQAGLVVVSLCRLTMSPLRVPHGRNVLGTGYSGRLNALVGECLRILPEQRARVSEVRESLKRLGLRGNGMMEGFRLGH